MNRDIWIFRDARSGSTGFAKYMAELLSRKFYCIDGNQYQINEDSITWGNTPSTELILNTHYPKTLINLHLYKDPFVFRCLRRNLCEQFLSLQLKAYVGNGFHNFEKFTDSPNKDGFYDFIQNSKLSISKKVVIEYLKMKKDDKDDWNKYTMGYQTHTIFYEDMNKPFDVPELNLYGVQIDSHTEKLPDYKRQVFMNYDEIDSWITELTPMFGLDSQD